MMAVCVSAGALLLVMLIGASYSYPAKQDPSSTYGSSYGANPASAGSNWEVPSSGSSVSNPRRPPTVQNRKSSYSQPSVQKRPSASSYSSNSPAVPVKYDSSPSAGSAYQSSPQPTSTQDIAWAVAPPSPFSDEETSPRPSAQRYASSGPAPEPYGPLPPAFQAGELSQTENSYEHGNYESETEEQGYQPPYRGVQGLNRQASPSQLQPPGLGRSWVTYPYDFMFLTGQYPPGTITHSSSSFEQGTDHWQDAHYIRDYLPANPTSFGQSGAATGAVGLQGSYFQPGQYEQPHESSPAGGGYGLSKVQLLGSNQNFVKA